MTKLTARFGGVALGVSLGLLAGCGGNTTDHTASGDAGTNADGDASMDASADAESVSVPTPRPIAPLSTATTTSQRPTFRWELADGTDGAVVDLCSDRLCSRIVTSFSAMGTSGRPPTPLGAGVYFWRLHGARGTAVGANVSVTWEVAIGARDAAVDTSWGTIPDFNGDGYADIVVGAYAAPAQGAAAVYLGGAATVPSAPSVTLLDPEPGSQSFGSSVASGGDVNGDGFADLLVAAQEEGTGGGRVYIYFGGPNGIAAAPSETLSDPAPSSSGPLFGYLATGVGDVNGDGYADALIAGVCPECADEAYVFFGDSTGLLSSPATAIAFAPPEQETFGWFSAASAGDTNGDGYGDIVAGSGSGEPFVGAVTMYLGSAQGIPSTPTTTLSNPTTTEGQFGIDVANAGDVNGDGYADVVVGSGNGINTDVGTFIYLGGSNGVDPTPATSLVGHPDSGGDFGVTVSGTGDVNGDGYADIVVGTLGQFVDVYVGAEGGIGATPTATFSSPGGATKFGIGLSGAGDVNGDGFADVIVGSTSGDAYLYLGVGVGAFAPAATVLQQGSTSSVEGFGFAVAAAEIVGASWIRGI